MSKDSLFCFFIIFFLFFSTSFAQEASNQIDTEQHINYRRTETSLKRDRSMFPLGTKSTGTSIWTEVHPLIPRVDFWGVDFVNADTGWAVGEGGAIIKTTNGGQKWIWYESDIENTLRTVSSVNGQRVIAAGDGGIIIISEDGGKSWNTLPSGTTDNIWNMQMITDEIGWIVGESATTLKTTDGGLTWNQQPIPYLGYSYWDVSFADTNVGYIGCPAGVVLKTTDGGINWIMQVAGDTRALWTIYAIDSMKVVSGGFAGKLVYTSDGGNSWIPLHDFGISYNKITFADSLTGIGSGDQSIRTTDGGLNWELIEYFNPNSDNNVTFATNEVAYIVGSNMSLLKSDDRGVNWSKTILNDNFTDVHFVDEMKGFFVGRLLYKTSDGAETLNVIESFPYATMYNPYSITFIDSVTGYAGGNPTNIIKTTDAGDSWTICNITGLPDWHGTVRKFFFLTKNTGWAVTSRGSILKTIDGGENWFTQLNAGIQVGFKGIHFTDSLNGWTANGNKRPYKTTDGGENWIEQTQLNIWGSRDVFFINSSRGFIVEYNELYYTSDGGNTFLIDTFVSNFGFARFSNFGTPNIIIVGNKVYRSIDSGKSWIEFPEVQGKGLIDLSLSESDYGLAIGSTGLIIKYDERISNYNESRNGETTPRNFSLYQNYPNPFNASTIIKYTLPENSFVNISIYDVKGEKVLELVSEEKEKGIYSIKLNGDKLSTGVFLYRMLTSSGFDSSKKLILLK